MTPSPQLNHLENIQLVARLNLCKSIRAFSSGVVVVFGDDEEERLPKKGKNGILESGTAAGISSPVSNPSQINSFPMVCCFCESIADGET